MPLRHLWLSCALCLSTIALNAAEPANSPSPLGAEQLGPHWRVELDANGRPTAWQRTAEPTAAAQPGPVPVKLQLAIDRHGPALSLSWQPEAVPGVATSEPPVVGPTSRPLLSAIDSAGIDSLSLWSSSGAELRTDSWSASLDEGTHQLSLRAVDRLGNRSEHASAAFRLDTSPPQFSWRRLDPVEGVPDRLYDGKRAEIELVVSDALAGIDRFQVQSDEAANADDRSLEVRRLTLTLTDAESSIHWRASDRVGNRTEGTLELQVDQQGPGLRIESLGATLDPDLARLPPDQPLRLIAVDDAAGVEKACVKSSIWREACRDLPLDLIGLSAGRYALTLFARDRLGNTTRRRFEIEVAQ